MADLNQLVRLPDGRLLGYDEYGPSDGAPLFYFHGTPSSRVEWQMLGGEELAARLHLRVVVADRPGIGLSEFQARRRFGDWPGDVVGLADHLGIGRFAVLGYSGGGPYALACALRLADRLTAVGVVSGSGPFTEAGLAEGINPASRRFFDLCRDKPRRGRLMLRVMGFMAAHTPKRILAQTLSSLPEPDRIALKQPSLQRIYLDTLLEAQRNGPCGAQRDTALMVGPWDFRPQDITIPVSLWHGVDDGDMPVAMGRYVARTIPSCTATFSVGEGHLSLWLNQAEEILRVLTAKSTQTYAR